MPIRHIAPAATLLAYLFSAFPARALDPARAGDRDVIAACITAQADKPNLAACLGKVTTPCGDGPDAGSTAGQNECVAREHAVWDELLNADFRRISAALTPELRVKFRDMQRVWLVTRDKKCALIYEIGQGTLYSTASAWCMMRETVSQLDYLRNLPEH